MPGRRRSGQVELNFDGLNDCVTNLVGALILLVVLLIGMTREITAPAVPSTPPPPEPLPASVLQGTRTVDDLVRQQERLRAEVDGTAQNIALAEQRLTQLRQQVAALLEKRKQP